MTASPVRSVEHLLREITPQVLGALTRRHRDFAAAEDAVQEALLDASMQWPLEGVPENPAGWLYRIALRRLSDQVRSESARRRREEQVANELTEEEMQAPAIDEDQLGERAPILRVTFHKRDRLLVGAKSDGIRRLHFGDVARELFDGIVGISHAEDLYAFRSEIPLHAAQDLSGFLARASIRREEV